MKRAAAVGAGRLRKEPALRGQATVKFLHRVDRIAEVFEGVVRLKRADLAVAKRPALVEISGDPSAVQIDRLATGNCRQILGATSLLRFHRPTHGMCESRFPAGNFERIAVN